jgi:hypothetical protein
MGDVVLAISQRFDEQPVSIELWEHQELKEELRIKN